MEKQVEASQGHVSEEKVRKEYGLSGRVQWLIDLLVQQLYL